jgi:hypothetical protein
MGNVPVKPDVLGSNDFVIFRYPAGTEIEVLTVAFGTCSSRGIRWSQADRLPLVVLIPRTTRGQLEAGALCRANNWLGLWSRKDEIACHRCVHGENPRSPVGYSGIPRGTQTRPRLAHTPGSFLLVRHW